VFCGVFRPVIGVFLAIFNRTWCFPVRSDQPWCFAVGSD